MRGKPLRDDRERPAAARGPRDAFAEPQDEARGRRRRPRKAASTKKAVADRGPQLPLTGKAIRALRGLGHALDPVLHVGKEGVTDAVVTATNAQLLRHELIKVRVLQEAPEDRKDTATALAERTQSTLAQVLGRTFLLYKRNPKKPKIVLPL